MLYDVTIRNMKRLEMSQVTSDSGKVRGARLRVPSTRGDTIMDARVLGRIRNQPWYASGSLGCRDVA